MRRVLLVGGLLVLAACGGSDGAGGEAATTSTSTSSSSSSTTAPVEDPAEDPCDDDPALRPLEGFEDVVVRITDPEGEVADRCMLLADDSASMAQGLMEQQDLRGYAGMLFRFEAPSESRFYMRNTRIPLSIAFFDEAGRFVSATDMEPCPDAVEACPTYAAAAPYLHAIEVAEGDLEALGLGEGSTIAFPG